MPGTDRLVGAGQPGGNFEDSAKALTRNDFRRRASRGEPVVVEQVVAGFIQLYNLRQNRVESVQSERQVGVRKAGILGFNVRLASGDFKRARKLLVELETVPCELLEEGAFCVK